MGYAAVNYVAVTEALGASPSIVAAGLAADNLICAVYFTTLFALASGIPPDPPSTLTSGEQLKYNLLNPSPVLLFVLFQFSV